MSDALLSTESLEEQLILNRVLLRSLIEDPEHNIAQEDELRRTIKSQETDLAHRRREREMGDRNVATPSAYSDHDTHGGNRAPPPHTYPKARAVDFSTLPPRSISSPSLASSTSNEQSNASFSSGSSPPQLSMTRSSPMFQHSLPSRKRERGSLELHSPSHARHSKSRRTSPGRAGSPDSFGMRDDVEQELLRRQGELEIRALKRYEQEKRDAAVAKRLQDEMTRSDRAVSMASRPSFQTSLVTSPRRQPPKPRPYPTIKESRQQSPVVKQDPATADSRLPLMGNFSGISGVSSDDDDELLEISANEFQHNTRSPPLHPTSASGSALSRTRRYGNLNPSADFIDIDDLEDAMSPLPSLPSTRLPSQNSSASFDIQPGRRDHYNKPDERSRFSSAVDAVRQGSATIGSHLSNLGSAVGRWMNVPEGYQPASPYGNLYGYPYSNEYGGAYGYGYPSPFGMPYGADRSMPGGSNSSYFNHLSHMVQSGKYGPNLSGDAFQALADRYDYIVNDPTKTREEIKALLDNIRPDEELPPENREGTPDGLKYPLMEHQKLGLSWLKKMEEGSNKGGILADDMGLGKTIQALALMLFRPSSDTRQKTTLIVAPVALLRQWEREIQTKVNTNHRLTTYLLHGVNKKNVTWNRIREHDVVLTTYGTLASEYNQKESAKRARRANPALRGVRTEKLLLLGDECRFHRVILDEAQCIKNKDTKAARAACCLQASTRFCMTGTPMMNNVEELYSLICFLRIKPYNELERFNKDFKRPLKGTSEAGKEQAMRKLQALLKAILLRRNKKSKIDGRPILQLPERTTEVVHAVFDNDESEFYRALETKTVLQFNKYLKAGTVGRNYSNILVLLLRLRQACCHPHLIKDFGVAANAELSTNDMLALAKELAPDVVARIKEIAAFECPVCYDAVENPAIFLPCGHDTCSECFTRISDPSQALTLGNEDPVVKCPSCRQVISPKRVIDYVSFKKVHMPTEAENEENEEEEEEEEEEEDVDSATESDEDDGDEDENDDDSETSSLGGFVVDDERTDDQDEEKYAQGDNPFSKAKNGGTQKKTRSKGKGKGKAKESKAPRKTLGQLKKEALRSVKAKRRYMRRLARDWVSSAKIDKACELLQQISDRKDGQKTIVFSQFTSLLDLLEVPVDRNGWGYRRYDGSMTAKHRHQAVIDFTDNPDCTIMLVSLKAGNAGLNLVAASQVIILDPFWNPYIEEQAIDRAHRIGQMRPVQVHRILVKDTVEDRIIDLQEKKRELIEGALDEKASQNISRLGTRELAFLFGVSNH